MKKNLLFAIILLGSACATKLQIPVQADADRMASKYPGLTVSALEQGKVYYEKYCQDCHKLISPNDKNEAQWTKIVPGMSSKANKKAGHQLIDEDAQASILKYLVTMTNKK